MWHIARTEYNGKIKMIIFQLYWDIMEMLFIPMIFIEVVTMNM